MLLKIIYCLFGLTSGALSITGYVTYLKRKEKKCKPGTTAKPARKYAKTLLKYTLGITGAILVLLSLHLSFGTAVASVPVSVILYGWLMYVTARWSVWQPLFKNRGN